ncbi:MAG: SDR family oxidoreductase [bacterium]|nr:SDR family oxidoreductase [bacterium]
MKSKKSILITGASTGIGKACALHLDKLGFMVFAGVRKDKDMDALNKEASDKLQPIILDVTKVDTINNVVEIISNEVEYPLFGLVNNAGIGINGVLEAIPETELRTLLEVNVIGLHTVTRSFLPLLRKNTGRIINIGSSASFMAGPGVSSYSASKFAVRAISDSLRFELQPFGMFVSLVAPGAIESDIWDKAKVYKEELRKSVAPQLLEAYKLFVTVGDKVIALIRPIPALEVAKVVAHGLTSKKPKYVYLVGKDAKRAYMLSKLPKSLFNWLVIKHLTKIAETSNE